MTAACEAWWMRPLLLSLPGNHVAVTIAGMQASPTKVFKPVIILNMLQSCRIPTD
jgi:fumarate hydratase class II